LYDGEGTDMEQYLKIGTILSTHGLKGEVKVFPTTDDPQRFKKLKKVILDTGKEQLNLEVQSVKFFKNLVILKFKEFDNINDVEKYKNADLLVTRDNAVKLKPGEYFIADLIGLQGVSDEGEDLGELTDVIQTGANDVYVFTKLGESDLLVPKIPDCVKEIDLEKGTVLVHLLPGLRD
jgi:16S rRNA processing protein RimM